MDDELYRELILEHYKHPHNAGRLDDATHSHKELNPSCGDTVEIFVAVKDGKVMDVKFDGRGCAVSQASASLLTDRIKGLGLEEIRKLSQQDIFDMLAVPIGVGRIRCALLSLKTLHKALEKHLTPDT
jgi:nitrogen fixation NifU-like protein